MQICLESAIKRIKIYAFAVAGMSRRDLATQAGLHAGATRHIHDDDWNPTLSTLQALERVIPPEWTFEEIPELLKPQPKETTQCTSPKQKNKKSPRK